MTGSAPTPEEAELRRLALRAGKCVAFLGSGVSIPPGRDWRGTVRHMTDRCGVHFSDDKQLTDMIDECIDTNEEECNAACRELFPEYTAASRTALLFLLRLPFKAILTVNFDPWLYQHSERGRYERCHAYPDLPLSPGLQSRMYYLHGYFNSGDPTASVRKLVFGERSFREAYEHSLLPGFLLNVFTYESILFIGVNLTEPHLAALLTRSIALRRAVAMLGGSDDIAPKRFVLLPAPISAVPEERAREDSIVGSIRPLEVTPVLYDRRAPDFRGLEEILHAWVREAELAHRPPLFATGFNLGDAGPSGGAES